MSGEVQEFGRFIYVEPNDFVAEELYGDEYKNHHNLTPSYEDYNIEVDLIVNIPDRFGGMTSEKISFFSGNNKYKDIISGRNFLSDVPGSTTYADIVNGNTDGVNENLCISNIHITYNSYFIPEITINFTDIRGGALFMINEELYRRDMINAKEESENKDGINEYSTNTNENNTNGNKIKNFFSSLFHFPYPEFKLQVKGFYGCKIEYSLLVTDFKSSFNSQTGNFDATVKFIGKMYGVYSDIPMEYLFIAPYCKYGSDNNEIIWNRKNFMLDDGSPMLTFMELKEKLLNAKKDIPTYIDFNDKKNYSGIKEKREILENIKKEIVNFTNINHSYDFCCYADYKLVIGIDISREHWDNSDHVNQADKIQANVIKERENIEEKLKAIKNKIDTFNSNNFGIKIESDFTNNIDTITDAYRIKYDGENSYLRKAIRNNDNELEGAEIIKGFPSYSKQEYRYLIGRLIEISKSKELMVSEYHQGLYFKILDLKKIKDELNDVSEKIEEEQKNIENKINEDINKEMVSILGFSPTIGNIFKILMAHLDCFTDLYHTLLKNIGTTRLKEDYFRYYDDVINNNYLPPFPGFKKNNEYCYPKDYQQSLEECKFINSLFDGLKIYANIKTNVDKLESVVNEGIDFIPTCASDYITNINPYKNIFKDKYYSNKEHLISTFFAYRCISYFIFERVYDTLDGKSEYLKNQKLSPEEFGRLEAYNFFLRNASLSPDEISNITDILSNELNGVSFIDFLTKEYFFKEPNYYKYNENSSTLLKIEGESGLKLKDELIYPAVINRDGEGLKSFLYDLTEPSVDFSFKNNYSMPLKFITSIDDENMEAFRENLKNIKDDALNSAINKIIGYKYYISRNNIIENDSTEGSYTATDDDEVNYDINIERNLVYTGDMDVKSYGIYSLEDSSIEKRYENKIEVGYNFNDKKRNLCLLWTKGFEDKSYMPCFDSPSSFLNMFFVPRYYTNYNVYGTIMDVSYRTLLYIGMIMYEILEKNNDGESIENALGVVSYFRYEYKDVEIKNVDAALFTMTVEAIFKKYGLTPYTSIVAILIPILFRKKDGTTLKLNFSREIIYDADKIGEYISDTSILTKENLYAIFSGNKTITSKNGSAKEFIKLIKETYKDGYIDCLGLIDEYKKWKDSTYNGSFNYFKKAYNFYGKLKGNDLSLIIRNAYSKYVQSELAKPRQGVDYEGLIKYINEEVHNITYGSTNFYDMYSSITMGCKLDTYKYIADKDNLEFYLQLNKNYYAYEELNKFYNKNKYLIIPYNAYSLIHSKPYQTQLNKNNIIQSFNAFKEKAKSLFSSLNEKNKENVENVLDTTVSDENKLSMYLTLKTLYDKHFYELPKTRYKFDINKGDKCDYNNIHYIDTLYNDLKDTFLINLNSVIDVINIISNGNSGDINKSGKLSDLTVYSFMSSLCEKHNMMLLSTPIFNGSMNADDLKLMFKPNLNPPTYSSPNFICFYPHKPSQHLDISDSQYENDGFNIKPDLNDTQNFEGNYTLSGLDYNENEYIIPAFGVEFGSQKQSIFKDININMDNPQTTEVAVATQFDLIKKKDGDAKTLNYYGQDLYKVYTNYSYSCQVNMMGCAQIQPLMYFQLNNIPMFRGAYQIIQVEHDITPGNMTTSFKGVRINKNKMPMVKTCINLNNLNEMIDAAKKIDLGSGLENKSTKELPKSVENNSDNKNEFSYDEDITMDTDNLYDYNMFIKDLKNVSFGNITTYYNKNKEDAFNELNQDLRYILYNIFKRASELYPKMKITISSSTRCVGRNSGKTSDHSIPDVEYNRENDASEQRKSLECNRITLPRKEVEGKTYLILNEKYYAWVEQIKKYDFYSNEKPNDSNEENTINVTQLKSPLSELGCAVDITTNSKDNDSIKLFSLIATEYTNCIRQLIWEVNDTTPACQNSISNCIHLASYGQGLAKEGGKNDKCEIFVAKTTYGEWGSVPAKLPTDIPYSFIEILHEISENNDKYEKITKLNNFDALGHKPTRKELEEWIESYNNQNND